LLFQFNSFLGIHHLFIKILMEEVVMSVAVQSGSSCCDLFSCTRSDGIKERVCPHWRMIPGLLALAASVVALVCALTWNSPYLCIAFAPGAGSSVYLIYLGWEFQDLKTYAENNEQLQGSVRNLQMENHGLQEKLSQFEAENKKLQESAKTLQTLTEDLKSENFNLAEANKTLNGTLADLEKLKITLETKAAGHVEQLSTLQKSLSGIYESVDKDHAKFAENLKRFTDEIELLSTTRSDFDKTGSVIEEKMKEQVTILLQAAAMLKDIFSNINDWKNDKAIEERLNNQRLLHQQIVDLSGQVAGNGVRIEEQKKQLEELAKIKNGFNSALELLLQEIGQIQGIKGELSVELDKVKKAAEVFKNFEVTRRN
jgi:DNA repair exonuclease SbcCD ATPase subunit